eukprot:1506823-Amphidinium_carterae.1
MRVRITVIESASEDTESRHAASAAGTKWRGEPAADRPDWIQQPHYKDGFFGVLHAADMENFAMARGAGDGSADLLPVGTLVRAQILRDKALH